MKTKSVFLLLTSILLLAGCGDKSDSSPNGPKQSTVTPGNAASEYVGGLAKGQRNAITTVDTASIDKAIQMFNIDKGRNPKDLNELVSEKFMPKLPDAPFGMKLDYDPAAGKVKVVKQ